MPRKKVKFQLKIEATGDSLTDLMQTTNDILVRILAGHMIGSGALPGGGYAFSILEEKVARKKVEG